MKPLKIKAEDLSGLTKQVQSKSDSAIGLYLYNGYRIQISKYKLTGGERVRLLYKRRRENGLCIVCGTKVKRVNASTGKLYRLCDEHRDSIDKKKGNK